MSSLSDSTLPQAFAKLRPGEDVHTIIVREEDPTVGADIRRTMLQLFPNGKVRFSEKGLAGLSFAATNITAIARGEIACVYVPAKYLGSPEVEPTELPPGEDMVSRKFLESLLGLSGAKWPVAIAYYHKPEEGAAVTKPVVRERVDAILPYPPTKAELINAIHNAIDRRIDQAIYRPTEIALMKESFLQLALSIKNSLVSLSFFPKADSQFEDGTSDKEMQDFVLVLEKLFAQIESISDQLADRKLGKIFHDLGGTLTPILTNSELILGDPGSFLVAKFEEGDEEKIRNAMEKTRSLNAMIKFCGRATRAEIPWENLLSEPVTVEVTDPEDKLNIPQGYTVYVIEDDPGVIKSMHRLFKQAKVAATFITTNEELDKAIASGEFKKNKVCILLDNDLKLTFEEENVEGHVVARKIRDVAPNALIFGHTTSAHVLNANPGDYKGMVDKFFPKGNWRKGLNEALREVPAEVAVLIVTEDISLSKSLKRKAGTAVSTHLISSNEDLSHLDAANYEHTKVVVLLDEKSGIGSAGVRGKLPHAEIILMHPELFTRHTEYLDIDEFMETADCIQKLPQLIADRKAKIS